MWTLGVDGANIICHQNLHPHWIVKKAMPRSGKKSMLDLMTCFGITSAMFL